MRPDYPIGLKNGILETKHFEVIGNSIWLYMWLIDRQTKLSNKVLNGKPITYLMFKDSIHCIDRKTYFRWLRILEEGNYIVRERRSKGYIITIQKSKKWLKNEVPKMGLDKKSNVPKMGLHNASNVPKMGLHRSKNGTSRIYNSNSISNIISNKDNFNKNNKRANRSTVEKIRMQLIEKGIL